MILFFYIGRITEAPRKRSVEILQPLESDRRDLYSGVLGYWCVGASEAAIGQSAVVSNTTRLWDHYRDQLEVILKSGRLVQVVPSRHFQILRVNGCDDHHVTERPEVFGTSMMHPSQL